MNFTDRDEAYIDDHHYGGNDHQGIEKTKSVITSFHF